MFIVKFKVFENLKVTLGHFGLSQFDSRWLCKRLSKVTQANGRLSLSQLNLDWTTVLARGGTVIVRIRHLRPYFTL